jgi:hypothetical protein
MNSKASYGIPRCPARAAESSRKIARYALRISAVLLLAASAYAQYGGGGTTGGTAGSSTPGTYAPGTPGYGNGKAIGIGVGAAAAGAGAIYFLTHRASKVTGCVESADDGLRLTDDKSKKTLLLVPGAANVTSGERVELKGKIKKNSAGDQSFLVKTVAKDFGQCRTQANAGPATALNSPAK